MKLSEAMAEYKTKADKAIGHSSWSISRKKWNGLFYLFAYSDGWIGRAYTGQLAGIPPRCPLADEDQTADDWEVWDMPPYED